MLPSTELDGAVFVAEKLRMALDDLALPHAAGSGTHLTVSIGVACTLPLLGDRAERLVGVADAALYEAKRSGRNRVCAHLVTPI